jgi:undecaprenyl-diphosphatase
VDAGTRAAVGAATVALTAAVLNRRSVGRREEAIFRAINDLPDRLFAPVWLVMQLGTLGTAPIAASIASLCGERRLGVRLLLGGTITWALSKVVKRAVRRPRPGMLIPDTRIRGREATGLGYLSGHAGVALALGATAWPEMSPPARLAMVVLVPLVGVARVYVGAHLPLDVAGGFALGLTVGALVDIALAKR